ncbi:MAG TPA: ABC transporter ATP-binding protein, partial [Sporichthyaceae bacterium]|nr:ABC transporter ATP-binding protein [Sporichthyaceae bacterium]
MSLEVRGLKVSYGAIKVLDGLDLTVGENEIVALIGPNGAGKTTTLNSIAGLVPRAGGDVLLGGAPLPADPEQVVRHGVALVPQGRRIFPTMTVEENLFMGAYARGGTWKDAPKRFAPIYEVFPRLAERRRQVAASLSGGEQQMLVIGRALLAEPDVMLIDELSLGLAPKMVDTLVDTIRAINAERGTAFLLVEQAATAALSIASTAYLLRKGQM